MIGVAEKLIPPMLKPLKVLASNRECLKDERTKLIKPKLFCSPVPIYREILTVRISPKLAIQLFISLSDTLGLLKLSDSVIWLPSTSIEFFL